MNSLLKSLLLVGLAAAALANSPGHAQTPPAPLTTGRTFLFVDDERNLGAGMRVAFSPDGIPWTKHEGMVHKTSYGAKRRQVPFRARQRASKSSTKTATDCLASPETTPCR